MAAWTPANLGASLLGWFDGADAASVTITGSGVSAWANKGVPPFTLTQGIDSLRPSYAANTVTFADNSAQNLAAGSPPTAYDFFIVGKPNSFNDWRNLFLSSDGSGTENTILIEATTGRYGVYGTAFDPAGGLTWANSASGLSYGRISAAGPITLSRDGGALVSTGVNHLPLPLQGVGSSGSYGGHTYTQGFGAIYELVFVPYNSSDDTRQRLEGYAAWKWGLQALLPVDHPYKAAPPTVGGPVDLAGGLTPSLTFAADLTVSSVSVNYVDFTGNLGGISHYGKLSYGKGHYNRIDPFVVGFSADLDIVGQIFFAGDLKPVVIFAGVLSVTIDLGGGDLAPVVTFAGTVGLQADLGGGIAPQIALEGSLSLDLPLQGDLPFQVDLACPGLISGPLWAGTEPCPSLPWTPTEPCPPSMWTPVPPPTFVPPSGGWTEPEKVDDLPVWGDAKN